MSQQRRQKKQLSTMDNVGSLSDHELREALKTYNQSPGPITDSTRNLYRKKLASLIESEESDAAESDPIPPQVGETSVKLSAKSELAFLASPIDDKDDDEDTSDEDFNVQLEEESDGYDDEEEDEDDGNEDDEDLTDEPGEDIKLSSTTQEGDTTVITTDSGSQKFASSKILLIVMSTIVLIATLYLYSVNNQKLLQQLQPFKNVTKQFITLVLLSPLIYGLYKGVTFYRQHRYNEIQRVNKLVTEALELLQSPDNPKGMMPILHIRDTLLSPSERKAKKTVNYWKQAVKFIEEHESRVKVELVNIDGEDFRAWKWIGSKKL